jgi:hypothetical protein
VGYERIKTEHAGAKNGDGAWMTRSEAKESARRRRRQIDKQDAAEALPDEQLHTEPQESSSTRSTEPPNEPWADPDPQPGDFDSELNSARPGQIQMHEGDPDAKLSIIASEGDEA